MSIVQVPVLACGGTASSVTTVVPPPVTGTLAEPGVMRRMLVGAVVVRLMLLSCVSAPLIPRTVSDAVPTAAAPLAEMVRVPVMLPFAAGVGAAGAGVAGYGGVVAARGLAGACQGGGVKGGGSRGGGGRGGGAGWGGASAAPPWGWAGVGVGGGGAGGALRTGKGG